MACRFWSGAILLSLWASPLAAQVADSSWSAGTPRLDEVVVREAGTRAGVERVPVADVIARSPQSVADLARLVPSAIATTNSRGETLLYVRGIGERQSTVLLDGAPMTVPWDRRLDLALVPAGVTGRLDLVRGPASLVWGPNTTGGVLDLVPRERASAGSMTDVEASGRLPVGGRLAATHLRRRGAWSGTLSVDGMASQGAALARELAFSQPDASRRTNSDRRAGSALARVVYAPRADTEVAVTLLHLDAAQGVPPEGHLDPDVDRVRYWRIPDWRHTTLVVRARTPAPGAALDATVWASTFGQTIHQFDDATYAQRTGGQRDADDTAGARAVVETVGALGTLRAIGWGQASAHRQTEVAEGAPTERFREAEVRLGIEGERAVGAATALFGVSWDGFAPVEAAGRPTGQGFGLAGLVARVEVPIRGGRAHAGLSRGGRFPTMRELYGEALGRFALNPDLGPETTWQAEVGAETAGRRASGWATGFARRTRGAIEQEVLPDGRRRRVNLGGSHAVGVEGGVGLRLGRSARLDGSATVLALQGVLADGQEVEIAERPEALARLAVSALPAEGWTWAAEALATGRAVSFTSTGTVDLPASLLVGGQVGHRWQAWRGVLDVFARVDNALDAEALPQAGLPVPGREVRIGLRWLR